jgi:hypothetical protein
VVTQTVEVMRRCECDEIEILTTFLLCFSHTRDVNFILREKSLLMTAVCVVVLTVDCFIPYFLYTFCHIVTLASLLFVRSPHSNMTCSPRDDTARLLFLLVCITPLLCASASASAEKLMFSFRHNWEHRELVSKQSKEIQALQDSCGQMKSYKKYRLNSYGMGSGLQSLSKAMCNAHHTGLPLFIEAYDWIWNDVEFCHNQGNFSNPLECYFGPGIAPSSCDLRRHSEQEGQYWVRYNCPKYVVDDGDMMEVFKFEGHFYEFLFQHLVSRAWRLA